MIRLKDVLAAVISAILVFSAFPSVMFGDEVVIDESTAKEEKQLGDYNFSTFPVSNNPRCKLRTSSATVNEITAGELWSYFDSQGMQSVRKLVICLDASEVPKGQALGLDLFEVRFEDTAESFTLGDNSLTLTADGTNALRPECHLEIPLDYDFMQRYSKYSSEKIRLNFGVNGQASLGLVPTFGVERRSFLTLPNMTLLVSFCLFWIVVFLLLKKYTLNHAAPLIPTARPSGMVEATEA